MQAPPGKRSSRKQSEQSWTTLGYVEKVRSQFLSLRQLNLSDRGTTAERPPKSRDARSWPGAMRRPPFLPDQTAFPVVTFLMNLDADNSSLFLRFAAVLAANIQNGPDLGVFQKIRSATVPCLNEFLLDAFPVTLLAGASQLHSGLIHFQSFFLAHVRTNPMFPRTVTMPGEADEKSLYDVLSSR